MTSNIGAISPEDDLNFQDCRDLAAVIRFLAQPRHGRSTRAYQRRAEAVLTSLERDVYQETIDETGVTP